MGELMCGDTSRGQDETHLVYTMAVGRFACSWWTGDELRKGRHNGRGEEMLVCLAKTKCWNCRGIGDGRL